MHLKGALLLQENLRWSCDGKTADKICSFNRHYAEVSRKLRTYSDFG